jgi:hypothetical protein
MGNVNEEKQNNRTNHLLKQKTQGTVRRNNLMRDYQVCAGAGQQLLCSHQACHVHFG